MPGNFTTIKIPLVKVLREPQRFHDAIKADVSRTDALVFRTLLFLKMYLLEHAVEVNEALILTIFLVVGKRYKETPLKVNGDLLVSLQNFADENWVPLLPDNDDALLSRTSKA
jgi:hypothetical protein